MKNTSSAEKLARKFVIDLTSCETEAPHGMGMASFSATFLSTGQATAYAVGQRRSDSEADWRRQASNPWRPHPQAMTAAVIN
jgi:shikimate kinase